MDVWTKSVFTLWCMDQISQITLLQLAHTVYYGREYEEKKERQKKDKGIGENLPNGYEKLS